MLENYQILTENNMPKFAVVDYGEFVKVRELLTDYEKLYDYLDFIDMQRIKAIDKTRYSLEEVKAELGL